MRDLVFVSAGLELDGGGRALAGRLLVDACTRFARERGIGFSLLTLERNGAAWPAALALSVWRGQWARRQSAYVFDLLGPARVQAYVPSPLRAPYLIPLYGIEVWSPLSRDRYQTLAKATERLAISRHTLERARPFCPDLHGTAVVPLALEERPPEGTVDRDLLDRVGEGFLLIVGRMASGERYKGHDQLLDVLQDLPEARLVVAGQGDDQPRLAAKAAGLGERVVFTGFASEATLTELYRRCATFVMPSRGEGFGLVYLEAMRAGKPVVSARGSAAEEIVEDGTTGVLVDPDNRTELAGALGSLLADPERARRLGEAGRERWRREFDLERFHSRMVPLLERLCAA